MNSPEVPAIATSSALDRRGMGLCRFFVLACAAVVALVPFALLHTASVGKDAQLATHSELELGGKPQAAVDASPPLPASTPAVPFSWRAVEAHALEFAKDRYAPTLLALLVDLVRRRSAALDVLSAGGDGAGQYLAPGQPGASVLTAGVEAALTAPGGRDCRRKAVLPVTCLLTSGESAFLQEWLAWHMAQGWAHVWIVVDMADDDPRWPTTLQILSPFALVGFITVVRGRKEPGEGAQNRLLNECFRAVMATGCFVHAGSGTLPSAAAFAPPWDHLGLPTSDDADFGRATCPAETKADLEWRRRIWLANIDDDEFAFMRDGTCITDFLPAYVDYGCVFMQWMFYGGHGNAVHPRNALVSETYTQRWGRVHASQKFFAHLPQIKEVVQGHRVILRPRPDAGDQPIGEGVNELFMPGFNNGYRPPVNATWPKFVLAHIYSRSMERTLLKWVKGRPGLGNKEGWPGLRKPSEVVSTQMNWPLPGQPLSPQTVEMLFDTFEPLPPVVTAVVRVLLGLPPRLVAVEEPDEGEAAAVDGGIVEDHRDEGPATAPTKQAHRRKPQAPSAPAVSPGGVRKRRHGKPAGASQWV